MNLTNNLLLELEELDDESAVYHTPVLVTDVINYLRPAPGMLILDGTLGGGGHSERFLQSGASVLALDQDPHAIAYAKARLAAYGERFCAIQANFRQIQNALDPLNIQKLSGALLDIGVSSRQLDNPDRGFAILKDGPLDMRMDPSLPISAADIVNKYSLSDLARIFREYGQEARALHIASRIVALRVRRPFLTTFDLVAVIESVVPKHGPRQPATRVFQALRIAVNDELGALEDGLISISKRLARGARFAVITFHSLEDRMVKYFFRDHSREWIDRPEWPAPRPNPNRIFRLLTPHPVEASREEIQNNPRARSAKLRVAERL
ncbi:MAG: 16S rRNA (cytosine(1402)-N(4))-methyltransferase [Verrucomicrobia bacterium]|nr:MAG: 16S rRNA (cytosine(1402)-N(4))-methyltransferase [Verrucomicrobiota bacterium]